MLNIAIAGLPELQRNLSGLGRDLNRAIATGINATASKVVTAEQEGFKTHLDRPTPFTVNSMGLYKASPSHRTPAALVFVKPITADYLADAIFGGDYAGLHPGKIRLNRYGNIPRRKGGPQGMTGLIANSRQFVGEINTRRGRTIFGLFERPKYKRKLKPWQRQRPARPRPMNPIKVLVYVSRSGRSAIMPWYRIAARTVEQHINTDILAEVNRLLDARMPGWRSR